MADGTAIEWTDATWNPVTGCSVVSPGCTNCYAMKLAGTRLKNTPSRQGLTRESKAGPVWNGEVRLNKQWLTQPLHWKRPRRIFVCAHGDLFAENVPDHWIDKVFAVMALSPQHTFQVLTKRPARMRAYVMGYDCDGARRFNVAAAAGRMMDDGDNAHDEVANARWPLPNVWLGVSAEDQARADERIPELLATPAAIRFVSAEPLLGPIDFGMIPFAQGNAPKRHLGHITKAELRELSDGGPSDFTPCGNALGGIIEHHMGWPYLDWIIVGGESGPNARPMHPAWARSIRDQCAEAGVPFFFKQWGSWLPWSPASDTWSFPQGGTRAVRNAEDWPEDAVPIARVGKKAAGRLLDGVEHSEFPTQGAHS